ncbi:hypothetical protein ACRRRS_21760 (plasmid) [Brucella anthropi]|uniref:hypothetical protein n=1 Tax=Brucella anthropi TaxID=529 RepID=UPI003D7D6ED0
MAKPVMSANEAQIISVTCKFDTSEALQSISRVGPVTGDLFHKVYGLCNDVFDLCKREAGDMPRDVMVITAAIVGFPAPGAQFSAVGSGAATMPVQLMWGVVQQLRADVEAHGKPQTAAPVPVNDNV